MIAIVTNQFRTDPLQIQALRGWNPPGFNVNSHGRQPVVGIFTASTNPAGVESRLQPNSKCA